MNSFWHYFSDFPVTDFGTIFGWYHFAILFRSISARMSLKVPWLVLVSFWLHFDCFGYFFGSMVASKTIPFCTHICKAPAASRRHPPSKEFFLSRSVLEPCRRHLRLICTLYVGGAFRTPSPKKSEKTIKKHFCFIFSPRREL